MINRPEYLEVLKRHKDKSNLIKVVTGIRRSGKTILFDLFQNYLRQTDIKDTQIITINLELRDFADFRNGDLLYKHVKELTKDSKIKYYVFLDELQLASEYEDVANSLRMQKNIDLYVTGSNSNILSGTIWGGRYIEIKMLPLSFKEYVSAFHATRLTLDELYQNYVEQSSFPETVEYASPNGEYEKHGVQDYLDAVYNSILVKDVMKQDGVKDMGLLERLIKFMFVNIGSESSLNSIVGVLNNDLKLFPNQKKVYAETLEKYILALKKAFLFYNATGYNTKGKEYLTSSAKYYAADVGLRYYLLGGDHSTDSGHILENIVYLELLRRGYKIKVGRMKGREIDFIAQKPGGKKEYYQVSQSVMDAKTLERELVSLHAVKDDYPKYLLTRDYSSANYNGIEHKNVLRWLLGITP